MTSPTLPACIPTAAQTNRIARRRIQHRRAQALRRKQLHEAILLFVFFTIFFAIVTIAAFS
jgi:hypothetical protein